MKFLQNIRSEILNSSNIQSCLVYPNARISEILKISYFESSYS
jgi:hypothetical protein